MAAPGDHYQRLGVRPSASTNEVRDAYRVLARRLHPDRMIDSSSAERNLADRRMREINESWHVLQDPVRRRAYDDGRLGARRATATATAAPKAAPAPGARSGGAVSPADDEDLVEVLPPMTAAGAALFRHLPWVLLVVAFGAIFIFSAYGASSDDDPAESVNVPAAVAGACVDVAPGPVAEEVPCSGPHEFEIVDRVGEGEACPAGAELRRLSGDGLLDCLVAGTPG